MHVAVHEQIQNLRLNRDVQRRGWLVCDQKTWLTGESDGDHDPLEHSTRHLMRIRIEALIGFRDSDLR